MEGFITTDKLNHEFYLLPEDRGSLVKTPGISYSFALSAGYFAATLNGYYKLSISSYFCNHARH